jgi:phosphoadenosine phosphosulfate reductase
VTAIAPATQAEVDQLGDAEAQDALAWAVERFGQRFAVVTAFQVEGMVVLDMARRIDPRVRVVTIDTGRLPEETFEVIDTVRARLGVGVEVVLPDPERISAMVGRHGVNLFRRDEALRRLCCHVRKVEPLNRVLAGVDAWAAGLRRDGGAARAGTRVVEIDHGHGGIVKLNPLANWTRARALEYAREHRLPMHPLYERGYASIGCAPCTRALAEGEDERAGRWWWEAGGDRECGLHHASPSERLESVRQQLDDDVRRRGTAGSETAPSSTANGESASTTRPGHRDSPVGLEGSSG